MCHVVDILSIFVNSDDLTNIVLSYSGKYFQSQTIHFTKSINIIEVLSNNKIAIATNRGVYILDLFNNNKLKMIHRNSKTKVSAMCELNSHTIACGFSNNANILIWNFMNDKKYVINNNKYQNNKWEIYHCKKNSLIFLKKDLIAYVVEKHSAFSSWYEYINIINLSKINILRITAQQSVNILMTNNKFISNGIINDPFSDKGDQQFISTTDLNACCSLNFKDYYKFKINNRMIDHDYPTNRKIISIDKDHISTTSLIGVFEMPAELCKNDLITTYDANTLEPVMSITENITQDIISLENGCMGVLTHDYINIYHAISGSILQIIDILDKKIKFIRYLNNLKFITVDDDSNIKMYEQ